MNIRPMGAALALSLLLLVSSPASAAAAEAGEVAPAETALPVKGLPPIDKGLLGLPSVIEAPLSSHLPPQAKAGRLLTVDPGLLEAIGTQESTGHTICCPCFACAYGDAVVLGVANGHEAYGCGNCAWTGWGGGGSFDRSLGSSQALLEEAYDEIAAGRPTVVHVAASWGEHWITLIGYGAVEDPRQLGLDDFVALDPWDGSQIIAGSKYALYGDGCEHISDMRG